MKTTQNIMKTTQNIIRPNRNQLEPTLSTSLLTAIAAVFSKSSKQFLTVAAGAVVVLGLVTSAAGAIIVPTGLNPGDKYHLAFVTSGTRDATSTSIADYNAFVQSLADAAGIGNLEGVTWFAIGSTATVAARDNAVVGATTPVYLLNGTTKVADGFADMWDSSLDNKLNLRETLTTYTGSVWTGSSGAGEIPSWGDQWLGDPDGEGPVIGNSNVASSSSWIDNGGEGDPATNLPMYALSEELTVAPIPEPGTMGLLGLALGAFFMSRRARKN